jgi:hypothetical protein
LVSIKTAAYFYVGIDGETECVTIEKTRRRYL